jgi:hypothetical protein
MFSRMQNIWIVQSVTLAWRIPMCEWLLSVMLLLVGDGDDGLLEHLVGISFARIASKNGFAPFSLFVGEGELNIPAQNVAW